jgi:hypothetical protein
VCGLSAEQALVLGEVLYVLRPSVYTWALRKFNDSSTYTDNSSSGSGSGTTSSHSGVSGGSDTQNNPAAHAFALMLSFAVEATSIFLSQRALEAARIRVCGQGQGQGLGIGLGEEAAVSTRRPHAFDTELTRRKTALLFYLLRSPLFNRTTLPAVQSLGSALNSVPLLRAIPPYIASVLSYLNGSHFYNSASS